jgi:hypothetical protein
MFRIIHYLFRRRQPWDRTHTYSSYNSDCSCRVQVQSEWRTGKYRKIIWYAYAPGIHRECLSPSSFVPSASMIWASVLGPLLIVLYKRDPKPKDLIAFFIRMHFFSGLLIASLGLTTSAAILPRASSVRLAVSPNCGPLSGNPASINAGLKDLNSFDTIIAFGVGLLAFFLLAVMLY